MSHFDSRTPLIFSSSSYRCHHLLYIYKMGINVREYRRDNHKWTIQRNRKYRVHKTKKKNKNTTQYVLDTTIHKQTQITHRRHGHFYKQPTLQISTRYVLLYWNIYYTSTAIVIVYNQIGAYHKKP